MGYNTGSDTSSTWGNSTQYVWLYPSNNSFYYTTEVKKEKKKEFIKESDFKV